MYPSNLQTNLRRREGAYGQTSLARAFTRNRQTGLSLVARSTFPRKNFRNSQFSAFSSQSNDFTESCEPRAEGQGLRNAELGKCTIGKPGL